MKPDPKASTMDIKQLGNSSTQALDSHRTQRQAEGAGAASSEASAPAPQTSKLQISAEAQAVKTILGRLGELPDVDNARVQRVKAAIDEGRYQVSAERIADKLLGQGSDESARKE